MNPGGDHLGFNYIPAPRFYMAIAIVWSVLLTSYAVFLWKHRNVATWVHIALLGAGIARIEWLIAAQNFWRVASKTSAGIPLNRLNFETPTGTGSSTWLYLVSLGINQAVFHTFFAVMSQGWLITRRRLPQNDVLTDVWFLVALIVINVLCRKIEASVLLIAFYLVYPGVLGMTISNCIKALKTLRLQLMLLSQSGLREEGSVVHAKEEVFRRLQGLVFTYISLKITVSVISLFLDGVEWIRYLIDELTDLIVSVMFAFNLRPNAPVNPFNTHIVRDWEAMFDGAMTSIAGRIAALGLTAYEVPRPEIYVAYIGARGRAGDEESDDVVVDISDDEDVEGVGCFHLILVEHPSAPGLELQNLAIAQRDPAARGAIEP
jgi:hypothetical protein